MRGTDANLITPASDLDLVNDLLENVGHEIPGLPYNLTFGRTGLFATVKRKLSEYEKEGETFFEKNPGIGREFGNLADRYLETIRNGNYVDYDGHMNGDSARAFSKLFGEMVIQKELK